MYLRTFARELRLLSLALSVALAAVAAEDVKIRVVDQSKRAVAGAHIELKTGAAIVATADTNEQGEAALPAVKPAHYAFTATRDGFEPLENKSLDLTQIPTEPLEITLVPAARRDSVDVHASADSPTQGSSAPTEISASVARELPSRPATVADALPLVPGVVRSAGGGLQISGSAEHRSALIVNSADVTDPATGQFGLTVPIDSVETVNVYQTPFLAEFGRFGAGLVTVETRRGGEKWKWDLNDPFPEFRIRSWDLRGVRTATPRLNLEGPIIPGKLYFTEGFEYALRKTEVYTLPFPQNQKIQEGVNSFSQLDWIVSSKQLLTATVHVAPQRLDFVNMNYFNPQSTTPDASTHNYTATIGDHYTLAGGMLDNTLSTTVFDTRVWGQGTNDFSLTPGGNSGAYFSNQDRNASRLAWTSVYTFAQVNALGSHTIKTGSYLAGSWDTGQVTERPINILDQSGQLLQRIAFTGGLPYHMTDMEYALFGQDHWILSPSISFDLGVRAESQQISQSIRFAPRAGLSWNPFPRAGTVIRAGIGLFYDRVPLNVYAFNHYPDQLISSYENGVMIGSPVLYENVLGVVPARPRLVVQEAEAGNFSPRSTSWSVQVEQPVMHLLKLRVGYMQSDSGGLVVLSPIAPDATSSTGLNMLTGTGQSRYRQFEVTTKVRVNERGQLFFSYVRSRARGNLNDFNNYLGSFPVPVIRADQFAILPTDLPNRFIAWGNIKLPWKFQISPSVEYRNGFPYTATDALQNYVGLPNLNHFPNFMSIDSRLSKDFKVNPKYSVRLSVTGYNLANHFNPEAVHPNVGDPAYGFFFGHRGRRFTADFDFIF